MRTRFVPLAAAACLAATFAGCKSTTPPATGSGVTPGSLAITASDATVIADNVKTVTLTVTNTSGSSATITTDRGTFSPSGLTTAAVTGASGTLTLKTCDPAVSGCIGVAHVSGVAGTLTASASVNFVTLATACAADCTAATACGGLTCTAVTNGTCTSTTPSSCQAPSGGGGGGGGGGGTTTGKVVTVTPARTRMAPDGSQINVVILVQNNGAALSGAALTLATTAGTLSATTGTTAADGTFAVKLTAPTVAGVATITATATAAPAATGTATVTFPGLGAILLVEKPVNPNVLGVKGSGWQELASLQVKAVDDLGNAYPDGLPVRFQHQRLGGSILTGGTNDATCTALAGCIYVSANTTSGTAAPDTAGIATAWIQSGTVAGTLAVVASATVGGVTRSINLPTAAVVGAKATGSNFSIVCGPRNVPAFAEADCGVSWVDAPFTCEALLKDRYGNLLGRATQVIFAAETSGVGPITTTPAYDPTKDAVSQATLGSAVQIFNTMGAGLPLDVPPVAGEPFSLHGDDGCGVRSHNPRDGVVTVIAIADGEEGFFDANGNGVRDGTEPFVDQGEPFVDRNDNGAWDAGEWFFDANGNGVYDGPNGQWDANTKIWTQTVVVYTGAPDQVPEYTTPAAPVATGNLLGARWANSGVQPCTGTAPVTPFVATSSKTGPPVVAAVSASAYVYASDMNLNMLTSATSYKVAVANGTVTTVYYGLDKWADSLGLFYRYWPCDAGAGGACASQCEATGTTTRCVMKPLVTNYGCGIGAGVTIKPSSTPEIGDLVEWDVSTPFKVYAVDKSALYRAFLSGSVN